MVGLALGLVLWLAVGPLEGVGSWLGVELRGVALSEVRVFSGCKEHSLTRVCQGLEQRHTRPELSH